MLVLPELAVPSRPRRDAPARPPGRPPTRPDDRPRYLDRSLLRRRGRERKAVHRAGGQPELARAALGHRRPAEHARGERPRAAHGSLGVTDAIERTTSRAMPRSSPAPSADRCGAALTSRLAWLTAQGGGGARRCARRPRRRRHGSCVQFQYALALGHGRDASSAADGHPARKAERQHHGRQDGRAGLLRPLPLEPRVPSLPGRGETTPRHRSAQPGSAACRPCPTCSPTNRSSTSSPPPPV
jgi:hypothetical protein